MVMETSAAPHLEERRNSPLPNALIGAAFLAVFIVFAASESWYTAFMAVHVSFVVIWIGGGTFLTLMAMLAERARDGEQLVSIAKQAAFAGEKVFSPAAIVVLAMGIAMTINAHLGFGHFWLIFGLIGFASTFVTGIGVLAPMSKKVNALIQEKGVNDPEAMAAVSRLLLIARCDVALLLLVVADMVIKPFS